MKIIIAGSRNINNYKALIKCIQNSNFNVIEIVSGAASGVDTMGEIYAKENNIPTKVFKADWTSNGKAAGPIRNRLMANYADALILFWDGKSKGSLNMLQEMNKLNKPVYQEVYNG